jgi:hypothetical protein
MTIPPWRRASSRFATAPGSREAASASKREGKNSPRAGAVFSIAPERSSFARVSRLRRIGASYGRQIEGGEHATARRSAHSAGGVQSERFDVACATARDLWRSVSRIERLLDERPAERVWVHGPADSRASALPSSA